MSTLKENPLAVKSGENLVETIDDQCPGNALIDDIFVEWYCPYCRIPAKGFFKSMLVDDFEYDKKARMIKHYCGQCRGIYMLDPVELIRLARSVMVKPTGEE